ncbi:hypothetical protein ABIC28_005251 [Rhodococcus sp. PvR044]|uniref:hypothetical protein n=1 Tax=Rhodococcus sp. PvR044 TaxID=3156402 RepID=UPI00339A5784
MLLAVVVVGALTARSQLTESEPRGAEGAAAVNPYEQARRAGVQDLLNRWAGAVRAGDTDALAALFDRAAAPEFLASEIRRSEHLAAVPLADWGYEIGSDPETPVPTDLAEQLDATDVWAVPAYLRYAVEGADAGSTRKPVSLIVARRGENWTLVSDRSLPEYGRHTWRGPWDFGPVVVREVETGSHSSVVLGHSDQEELIDAIAADLADAVSSVTELWGPDWSQRALVVVSSSQEEFMEQVGADHSGSDIAAVAVSDVVEPGSDSATGQRVVFSPAASERLDEDTRHSVLRHELTHVAARAATTDGSPMWMLEGFADYAGHRDADAPVGRAAPILAAAVVAHGPPTRLPVDADFMAGGERAQAAYELAWSVSAFVADRFDEPTLRELYVDLATGPVDSHELDVKLHEAVGLSASEFVTDWGRWVAEGLD